MEGHILVDVFGPVMSTPDLIRSSIESLSREILGKLSGALNGGSKGSSQVVSVISPVSEIWTAMFFETAARARARRRSSRLGERVLKLAYRTLFSVPLFTFHQNLDLSEEWCDVKSTTSFGSIVISLVVY